MQQNCTRFSAAAPPDAPELTPEHATALRDAARAYRRQFEVMGRESSWLARRRLELLADLEVLLVKLTAEGAGV